jgi:hypothetical protein
VNIAITLVGGPADGREVIVPDAAPPFVYKVALPKPLTTLLAGGALDLPQRSYSVAQYGPVLADGWPSVTDDGRYRYRFLGMEEEPHVQARPTPSLEALAALRHEPPASAYPDARAHLLACRTWYSLRRDAALGPEERAARDQVVVEHVRAALDERHRGR